MLYKTRHEKFEKYFERYNIRDKLTIEKARDVETPGGITHSVKKPVERFATTPDCVDFFDENNKDLWLPEVKDAIEYLHQLNQSKLIKAIREHTLKCRKCAVTLDAFLLSQVQPDLFHGVMRNIIAFETHQDKLKNTYVVGLPWPGHEASTQTGRLVYVTALPIRNGVWEFEGRVVGRLAGRGADIQVSDFTYITKHDGQRTPCYQATAHLLEGKGYVCIRSKAGIPAIKEDN